MFERYTEKARRAIFFARYEASQFGSSCIESEHLLLGVLREDKIVTDRLLGSAVESIRLQIRSHAPIRKKISVSVDLPLSEECKRVLAFAAEEANLLGYKHIGTDHLYLGVLREQNSFPAQILTGLGLKIDQVREWVADASSLPPRPSSEIGLDAQSQWAGPGTLEFGSYSFKAARAILLAGKEADRLASSTIDAEHLLLGLLREDKAISTQLLHSETALESIRQQVESKGEQAKGEPNTPQERIAGLRQSIRSTVKLMEGAIAAHQFEKAHRYSDEERRLREALRVLLGKHNLNDGPAEGLPLSNECQRVLNQGAEEAKLLKQRYIGTEHLLLGILREEKSFAADILHVSGLQLAQAREEIARWNQEQGGDHV